MGVRRAYRPPMEFNLLGSLEVRHGRGVPIPIGGRRQRLVLALLVLRANEGVTADQLIDDVWGDQPPPGAQSAVYAYVSRLRRALGGERITGGANGYQLRARRNEIDVSTFEDVTAEAYRLFGPDPSAAATELEGALALWRGPAFGDLADEPSLRPAAARLDEMRLSAIETYANARLALGQNTELISILEQALAGNPLRERLWGQLMLALYRSGRQADALQAYRRARLVLDEELGVEPSPELERLQGQILRHEPVLEAMRDAVRGYRLHERIGEGAFGTVYRATQPGVGRDVAIKMIHHRLANNADFVRNFEHEAQLIAQLEHPHVVPLHDYWREPGSAYLVMRFLRGGNLSERIAAGGALAPDDALRIVGQVAAALAAAHRQGIVHRDVRPPNILFDDDGNAYLSDFGIAKQGLVSTDQSDVTSTGLSYYLSPEEIAGRPISPATDIYSLGMVVFEALGGRHPLADTPPADMADRHLRGAIPSLGALRPGLPAAVEAVIERATALEATSRFPDTLAFADALRSAFEGVDTAAIPAEVELRSPYKGLRPYAEPDAADFFGREALLERLVSRLAETSAGAGFLAVVGPSGSGKSSVVRAALLPALRSGAVAGSEKWFVTDMHPGSQPFDELAGALLRVASRRPTGLARRLVRDPAGLSDVVAELLPSPDAELLLVIDQFEEVFTLTTSEESRLAFLGAIAGAVAEPGSRLRVVTTLRADFFDRPLLYRVFGDLLAARTEAVTPLSTDELRDAVVGPAGRVGLEVEPALLAQLLSDTAQSPGSLPLLQYALSELYERREGRLLTLSAYRQIGGLSGAVGRRADQVVGRLNRAGKEAVRQLFLRLVTITDDGTADVRRRVLLAELNGLEQEAGAMQRVLDTFGRHRLLSFDRDPLTRGPTVEVAHEALLREWGRLRGWLESAWDDVRTHRLLAAAAAEWRAGGQDSSFLPRGSRLDQFENWASSTGLALTDHERAFLEAAIALRQAEREDEEVRVEREAVVERRSRRRLQALAAVMSVAAVVAVGLSLFAFQQQQLASGRELAAAAVSVVDADPELSILLARRAVETTRGADGTVLPEAEEALHRAVVASRVVDRFQVEQTDGSVDWSPDGALFLVAGTGPVSEPGASAAPATVWVYDRASGDLVRSWAAQSAGVSDALFSPLGTYIATAGADGTVMLWDGSGAAVQTLVGPEASVADMSFSADEKLLAGVWQSPADTPPSALIWDVESGELVRRIDGLEGLNDTSLDSDGARVALASGHAYATGTFDVATGSARGFLLPPVFGRDTEGWSAVAWSPDDELLAAAQGSTVRIYPRDVTRQLFPFAPGDSDVTSLTWSADGSHLLVGSSDGDASLWEVGHESAELVLTLASQSSALVGAALSPDGNLAFTADADGGVASWDVTREGSAEWFNLPAEPTWRNTVVYGSDGRTILGTVPPGGLRIWDATGGGELLTVARHGRGLGLSDEPVVQSTSVSPDGTRVVTGGRDLMVNLWDTATGAHIRGFAGHRGYIQDTQFSPRGDLLATASDDGTARVFEGATMRELRILQHDDSVMVARFTHDGSRLVTGSLDGAVRVWDPNTGEEHRRIEVGWPVTDVGLDPEGRRVGVGGGGGAALYDLNTGELLHTVAGQTGAVWAVRFSPDGRLVASGSVDGTIRIWDPATGVVRLRLFQERVDDIAFSPDGSRLAVAGRGVIRVWALDIDDLLEIASRNVARSLTDDECRQYLHVDSCP